MSDSPAVREAGKTSQIDTAIAYDAAQPWSHRLPSSPQAVIPPYRPSKGNAQDHRDTGSDTPLATVMPSFAFLQKASHADLHAIQDTAWPWDYRYQAQRIIPFIYLGSLQAARDKNFLRQDALTMLLVIRTENAARAGLMNHANIARELNIAYASVDVPDMLGMTSTFPCAIEIINRHMSEMQTRNPSIKGVDMLSNGPDGNPSDVDGGKVLVYCETGNLRSAAVVVAYLMAMYGLHLTQALRVVTARRGCVGLDNNLRRALLTYEDLLEARGDVLRTLKSEGASEEEVASVMLGTSTVMNLTTRSKRTFSDADEVVFSEPLNLRMDVEPPRVRPGVAPFQDQDFYEGLS